MHAQYSSVFEKLTVEDGLPSNYIFCIEEDLNGFTWIGTDKGLCKFNGVKWDVWDTENGLPGNYINNVKSDGKNGLILAISEKGEFYFDLITQKITPYKHTNNKKNLSSFKTEYNLVIVNQFIKNKFAFYYSKMNDKLDMLYINDSVTKITSIIYLNKNKNIQKKLIHFSNNINSYNLKSKQNIFYNRFVVSKNFIISNNFIINVNNIKDGSIIKYNFFKPSNKIFAITENDNFTYTSKIGEGLFKINNRTNEILEIKESSGLGKVNINQLFINKDGDLNIATLGNGIIVLPKQINNHFENISNPLKNMQAYNDKYAGLGNGIVYIFDKDKIVSKLNVVKDAHTFYLKDNQLTVGSFNAIYFYNIVNNEVKLKNKINFTTGISSILPFDNNYIFSTYGSGFYETNKKILGAKKILLPFDNIEKTISLKKGYAALSYEEGFFTTNETFSKINSYNTKNGLLSNYITDINEHNDTLLVGSKKGLSIIYNEKVIKNISYENGFKGNNVVKIFISPDNKIYVISDGYIQIYSNGIFKTVDIQYLTNSEKETIKDATYNAKSNELILSTNKKLSIINLSSIISNEKTDTTKIVEIKIDEKAITSFNNFTIPYVHNNIQFICKPLYSLIFDRSIIMYKLNENEWEKTTDNLNINLKQLRWGKYNLYLKTINTNGIESDSFLASTFTVERPWWLQWWSIIITALLVLFLFFAIVQNYNNRKYEKKLALYKVQQQLENERQRISRDLHDNMGTYTTALIATVQKLKSKNGDNEETQKIQSNAENIMENLRETIWVLKNNEISIQDFSDNFKSYCLRILKNYENLNFNSDENIETNTTLSPNEAVHLNRVLQEIVQNIIKHATATEIKYTLNINKFLQIIISDNGKGFDVENAKHNNGLDNIEWRCKEINFDYTIDSILKKGTTITIKSK